MSLTLGVGAQRAGAANCVCPPDIGGGETAGPQPVRTLALLGAGAAASTLSQVLMFSLLPLVGRMLAPAPVPATVPFIALFVGAVAATFPAAMLTDAFGRRTAFALGASLGVAGGLVVAWGLIYGAFWALTVGAFWLGIANGFALRYRHVAAASSAGAVAIVVGCGAVIGLVVPTVARLAETSLTPFLGAGTALLAAAAHIFALGAALALPAIEVGGTNAPPVPESGRGWFGPTLGASAAWFGMMAIMAFAPLGLAGCGVGFSGTVGAVAWHVVAMYAPVLALSLLAAWLGEKIVILAGLCLVGLAALGLLLGSAEPAIIVAALIATGAGWSLATSAALISLHRAAPSRLATAGHDACILLAGVGGALLSGMGAI